MKTLGKKLKNRRGETLLEVLVAILVFTLSSIVMYSMVTTATDLNFTAKKMDEQYRQQMYIAERADGAKTEKTMTLTLTGSGTEIGTSEIVVYRQDSNSLYSYYRIPEGGG